MIDLSKCRPGDLLRMRNGHTAVFEGPTRDSVFPFRVRQWDGIVGTRTRGGGMWTIDPSSADIVEILGPVPPKTVQLTFDWEGK